jgi:hypothetical protein
VPRRAAAGSGRGTAPRGALDVGDELAEALRIAELLDAAGGDPCRLTASAWSMNHVSCGSSRSGWPQVGALLADPHPRLEEAHRVAIVAALSAYAPDHAEVLL